MVCEHEYMPPPPPNYRAGYNDAVSFYILYFKVYETNTNNAFDKLTGLEKARATYKRGHRLWYFGTCM